MQCVSAIGKAVSAREVENSYNVAEQVAGWVCRGGDVMSTCNHIARYVLIIKCIDDLDRRVRRV